MVGARFDQATARFALALVLAFGASAVLAQSKVRRTLDVAFAPNGSADVTMVMEYPTNLYVIGGQQFKSNPYLMVRDLRRQESLLTEVRDVKVNFDDAKNQVHLTLKMPSLASKPKDTWTSAFFANVGYSVASQTPTEVTLFSSEVELSTFTLGEQVEVAATAKLRVPSGATDVRFDPKAGLSYRLETPFWVAHRYGLFLLLVGLDVLFLAGAAIFGYLALTGRRAPAAPSLVATLPATPVLAAVSGPALPPAAAPRAPAHVEATMGMGASAAPAPEPAVAATMRMALPSILLEGVAGPAQGKRLPITFAEPEARLGRDPGQANVIVEDGRVSRLHAVIQHHTGVFTLRAVSKTNPTWVNDQPVQEARLNEGDRIRLGDSVFLIRLSAF